MPGMLLTGDCSAAWTETPIGIRRGSRPSAKRSAIPQRPLGFFERPHCPSFRPRSERPNTCSSIIGRNSDSSIIAGCLAAHAIRPTCINFATKARDGDERDFAREVTSKFSLQLIEVAEPEPRLETPASRSFRPGPNPLLAPSEYAVGEARGFTGASELIDGGGGDNLFCATTSGAPVIDALMIGGFGEAWMAIRDIARRADCTIYEVLKATVRRNFKPKISWKEDRTFLNTERLFKQPDSIPGSKISIRFPGKREHVEALVHIQDFLDRTSLRAHCLHPLLAQPLLELCLRIPSWFWMRGGRDRAIARDAFTNILPNSVIKRRLKGSLQSMFYRSFSKLRFEMGELLEKGELAPSWNYRTPVHPVGPGRKALDGG